jgi:small nuclear ribonucleoprotein (snRNP)-like protein
VVQGDLVPCFDDDMNMVIKPVVWSGKTGHKETIVLTIKKESGEVVNIRCTPEHKIRLVDGSYKRADSLLPTDNIAEEV